MPKVGGRMKKLAGMMPEVGCKRYGMQALTEPWWQRPPCACAMARFAAGAGRSTILRGILCQESLATLMLRPACPCSAFRCALQVSARFLQLMKRKGHVGTLKFDYGDNER